MLSSVMWTQDVGHPLLTLAPATPPGALCSVFSGRLSAPLPFLPPPSTSCLPNLDLCQEVDGLREGHQAILVQDQLPQLRAPVTT